MGYFTYYLLQLYQKIKEVLNEDELSTFSLFDESSCTLESLPKHFLELIRLCTNLIEKLKIQKKANSEKQSNHEIDSPSLISLGQHLDESGSHGSKLGSTNQSNPNTVVSNKGRVNKISSTFHNIPDKVMIEVLSYVIENTGMGLFLNINKKMTESVEKIIEKTCTVIIKMCPAKEQEPDYSLDGYYSSDEEYIELCQWPKDSTTRNPKDSNAYEKRNDAFKNAFLR